MSPREKRIVLLSALGLFLLAFYFIPSFLYATLIFLFCCFACYYNSGETLLNARLGPNPRAGLNLHAGLRRWLADWGATGLSVNSPGGRRISSNTEVESQYRQRLGDTGIYRREALASDSFFYSPRDFLMGSYIGKPESPSSGSVRPRAGRNPREQLREKLSRPNHAVYTPNRRLSFAGESLGYTSRFNITPQRHYPLQQPGLSSVGVLPPVRWDGFRQKNILSPRNSPAAHSPVTVKIARPDLSSPRVDHLSCSRINRAAEDPCSRESVLRVLKESRKREVGDEDRSFTTEQKSKRRRNDSGGSAHSAFEPLLPNGAPSQLVPKPGTLKRGITSVAEESTVKRSRTSSISSGTGAHASRESSGTRRNAIQSSYSSTVGLNQWKKPSTPSSPLSSPGSSRSQTPDVAFKKPREEDTQSPSSASSAKSEQMTSDKAPATSKPTLAPNVPVTSASDSAGGGGKRKRKIQLVSSNRDDHISLPPPPELGYKVTAKDLDEEKEAAISKIQKVLETPAPEPEKSAAATIPTSTPAPSSTIPSITPTLSSLLAAPLPKTSTTTIPVINLDPSPSSSVSTSTAAASSNPLLEALKMKINTTATSASPLSTTTVSSSTTPVQTLNLKSVAPSLPTASQPQSSPAPLGQPSAFTQVLGQICKAPTSSPAAPVAGPTLFGLSSQISPLSAPSTSAPVSAIPAPSSSRSSSESVSSSSSSNPLLVSGFKPIFAAATTTTPATSSSESKPPVPNFKPIFGETTAAPAFAPPSALTTTSSTSTPTAGSTPSLFGALTSSSTTAPSAFSGFNTTAASVVSASATTTQPGTQMAAKSLFGSWSAATPTSSASASVQPPSTGGTFQFGAAVPTTTTAAAAASTGASAATTTSSSQGSFPFGVTKPNPQPASQSIFGFGQTAPNLTTTAASFGGFSMTSSTSTTAPTSTSTQSSFTFGKPAFEAPTTQPSFGSAAAAAKPFTFGSSASNPTPVSNNALGPFSFGAAPTTTAATFGTQPAKPAFGASSTGFGFGSTTAPSAAPSFGPPTQTQSSTSTTFTFGAAAPQPAPAGPSQPASGGFNFGTTMPCPQFGAQVSNSPAPQMGGFNFGAAAAADKPGFGTATPSFGQSPAAAPFGSPGTPVQGFNPVQFGSPATPTFSIGAGSKPSGARQRLQARRQHHRKK